MTITASNGTGTIALTVSNIQNAITGLTVPTASSWSYRPGVTKEQVCKAFLALAPKYQQLVEMTKD